MPCAARKCASDSQFATFTHRYGASAEAARSTAGRRTRLGREVPGGLGYRRIDWIETAIEPLRGRLDDAGFERLVSALAMVIGWEALIVLQDLRGLTPDEQAEVSTWAARTHPGRSAGPAGDAAARALIQAALAGPAGDAAGGQPAAAHGAGKPARRA